MEALEAVVTAAATERQRAVGRGDPVEMLLLTTVLSHVAMLPAVILMYRRRWIFEFSVNSYCMMSSFMYHLTESIQAPVFLPELKWHRLDNIGALCAFGFFFTYMAHVKDPALDFQMKFIVVLIAILTQEKAPWDVNYTFIPILFFGSLPFIWHLFIHKRPPHYEWRHFFMGFGSLLVAACFFVRGLDDRTDPFRMYHGLWHVVGGFSSWHLWHIVQKPTNVAMAQFFSTAGRVVREEPPV
jgi:hypothetical protein